jgi:hypothetical protein
MQAFVLTVFRIVCPLLSPNEKGEVRGLLVSACAIAGVSRHAWACVHLLVHLSASTVSPFPSQRFSNDGGQQGCTKAFPISYLAFQANYGQGRALQQGKWLMSQLLRLVSGLARCCCASSCRALLAVLTSLVCGGPTCSCGLPRLRAGSADGSGPGSACRGWSGGIARRCGCRCCPDGIGHAPAT